MTTALQNRTKKFRDDLTALGRDKLMNLLYIQDPDLVKQVNRIEWVFENKLTHLTWPDGTPVEGRPVTDYELALLVDEPFTVDPQLTEMGISAEEQRKLHIAKDPVTWSREMLGAKPRVYQILMLRHPSNRKVLRAGRRLGKTWTMAITLLHYSYITSNGRSIVVTPFKQQGGLIYEQIMKMATEDEANEMVAKSIIRHVTSPQYEVVFANGSTIRFFSSGVKSGGKCLTPDHDVLCRDGWKPIADVVIGEEIASFRDEQMIWSPVSNVWDYDHDDDIITHYGKQLSFSVTPNHKFLAKTTRPESQYRFVEAENLKQYAIPTTGEPFPRSGDWYSGDELELWGWWLAEGSGYIGKMARFSQVKTDGRARIIELAERLGLHYTTPAREIRIEWRPPIECGTNAYNKFIPRLLFEEQELPRLMEGLLGGDGYIRRKGWEYSSSSFSLANDVQEVGIRLGYRANIREKKLTYVPVGGGANNPHWVVSAYPRRDAFIAPNLLERVRYTGKVHCVTVPETGVFLTRHNGLVHITGNSDVTRGQEAHLIILDELDYMGQDDLVALYAMLQQTDENQSEKLLMGASTPSGRQEMFWEWCLDKKQGFTEFWYPSYANPFFNKELEEEMRGRYSEMQYRHEIEADWGENAEGVYPRRFLERAFINPPWDYNDAQKSGTSFFVMGVDWNKYQAGTNIVVLEVCDRQYREERFRNKIKLAYREEVAQEEFTYINAMERIKELNKRFNPEWIYVDRGYGEVQIEELKKYGMAHPNTRLKEKIRGIAFKSTVEVPDPMTGKKEKKEVKPFMVENLRRFLEREQLLIPFNDVNLFSELIGYIVIRTSAAGVPVFGASGSAGDNVHDALILALLAITQNYDDIMTMEFATGPVVVSNSNFMPLSDAVPNSDRLEDRYGSDSPVLVQRAMSAARTRSGARPYRRKMF